MEEISVICRNEDETVAFAQKLSQIAKVGDTFALFGTLGMGKSVFASSPIIMLTLLKKKSPHFFFICRVSPSSVFFLKEKSVFFPYYKADFFQGIN